MKRFWLLAFAILCLYGVFYSALQLFGIGLATGAVRGTSHAGEMLPTLDRQAVLWIFALLFFIGGSVVLVYFALRRRRSGAHTTSS
jgi:hypothetical protein